MKRQNAYLSYFLATLAAFFCLLTLPTTAQATVTCTKVSTSQTTWPYGSFSYYCGAATQANGQTVASAEGTMGGYTGNTLSELQPTIYLFHSPAEYAQNFPSPANPTPASADFGIVIPDTNNVPVKIAVFETNGLGQTPPNMTYAAGEQLSHATDRTMSYLTNGGIIVLPYTTVSGSSPFTAQLNLDWSAVNAFTPCGSGALFYNEMDATGNYICSSSGSGATLVSPYNGETNNEARLATAWPGVYVSSSDVLGDEITFNTLTNVGQRDSYFNTAIKCSDQFLLAANNQGVMPTSTNLNQNAGKTCAVPPTSYCKRQYGNTGWPTQGYMFDCAFNLTQDPAPQILNNFSNLGGTQGINNLKTLLKTAKSYIYFFQDPTTYQHAMTAAGVSTTGANLTGSNGVTAPIGKIWYTFMNISAGEITPPGGNPDIGSLAYITSHELGHAVDFNTSQPSNSTAFDLAVQHDIQDLDYYSPDGGVTFLTRHACWFLGSVPTDGSNGTVAAPYTGPFVGVTDPNTGNQICNGQSGAFTTGEAFATRNSSVLNQYASYPASFTREIEYQKAGTSGNNPGITTKAGWREIFAQGFAMQAQPDVSGTSNRPMLDLVVQNGFFSCTQGTGRNSPNQGNIALQKGWLYYAYHQVTLVQTTHCKAAMTGGWTEYQPIDPTS